MKKIRRLFLDRRVRLFCFEYRSFRTTTFEVYAGRETRDILAFLLEGIEQCYPGTLEQIARKEETNDPPSAKTIRTVSRTKEGVYPGNSRYSAQTVEVCGFWLPTKLPLRDSLRIVERAARLCKVKILDYSELISSISSITNPSDRASKHLAKPAE